MHDKPVLLIAFYNKKSLGVRYLERSLIKAGHRVHILFLKNFNSKAPEPVTEKELALLRTLVAELDPGLIGLSVMSSLYLESVISVNKSLRARFGIPIVWGGVYASMFPERCLEHADFVLRGESEEAIVELADAVLGDRSYEHIKNLAYKIPSGSTGSNMVINDLRPLCENLDALGYPIFSNENKCYIDRGRIIPGDPMLDSASYELSASRGCPFVCSYCSSVNLKRMYAGKGRFVRFRSPASIISELREALGHMKGLKVIHFWDEIFPDDRAWTDEFAMQYKSCIGLPFVIWVHPLRISEYTISKLADAGLYKTVMGIQSGSSRIRSDIFHRRETRDDILRASEILSGRVRQISYDFMLRHPFESEEDLKQTFEMCTELHRPFELQLHGLSFLPGTDIISIAEKNRIEVHISESGPDTPMRTAYKAYWGQKSTNAAVNFWYSLIYMSQFSFGLHAAKWFSRVQKSRFIMSIAILLSKLLRPAALAGKLYRKAVLLTGASLRKSAISKSGRHTLHYSEGK
ncbi:MAG: radical SAM protein [Acetivibrionales bacterium]|nr:radical SAM protein [Bacillota bacterium]HQD31643.1 radical SAM protein [Clostridiales bacterium]